MSEGGHVKFITLVSTLKSGAAQRGPIYHDIIYNIAMTTAEPKSDFDLSKDTLYLALSGKL